MHITIIRRLPLASLVLSLIPDIALSSPTTPGNLSLSSTFQCISVRGKFSGDTNANNSATVQFRRSGDSIWHNAYTPMIDRRTNTDSYVNEARVSIVGLMPNTSYDVAVTWSDPDGVIGNASITNTVSTLSYSPPMGGSTITVSNDVTLSTALGTVLSGQTIHLNPGIYSPFRVSRGGLATAYCKIEGDTGGGAIIAGTNVNQNVYLAANYVVLSHLTLGSSDHSGLIIGNGLVGLFVQDCTFQNISVTSVLSVTNAQANYGDCGINIASGCSNIFILRNSILSPALTNASTTLSPNYASPGTGIGWGANINGLVVQSNNVIGGFRDAISLDDGYVSENIDLVGNVVSQYKDDGLESKGANVNVRVWGNRATNDIGNTFFAFNEGASDPSYGPCYIFRNTCWAPSGNVQAGAAFKLGPACSPTFIFHNTIDSSIAGLAMDGFSPGSPITAKNNLMKTKGSCIIYAPSSSRFDYNLYYITSGAYFVYNWNGQSGLFYDTLATFNSATGQEQHGQQKDPLLNGNLTIPRDSPAVGAGALIPNFNGADSAWPPATNAPTIGSFEPNITLTLPLSPTGLRVIATQP